MHHGAPKFTRRSIHDQPLDLRMALLYGSRNVQTFIHRPKPRIASVALKAPQTPPNLRHRWHHLSHHYIHSPDHWTILQSGAWQEFHSKLRSKCFYSRNTYLYEPSGNLFHSKERLQAAATRNLCKQEAILLLRFPLVRRAAFLHPDSDPC